VNIDVTCFNIGRNSSTMLANTLQLASDLATGVYGNFTYIFRTYLTGGTPFSIACQQTQNCIVLDGLLSNVNLYSCGNPLPVDCISNGLSVGQLRFPNTISGIEDTSVIFDD